MTAYIARCDHCNAVCHGEDAYDVIATHKWRLDVNRNHQGKPIGTIWHCTDCKNRGKVKSRPSQLPHT